jgi:hypothetical protein
MNNDNWVERRITDEAAKRAPQDVDRFENEGGPGPEDNPKERRADATGIVQPELPRPVASPRCDGTDIPTQSVAGDRVAADPTQVIVTAGATAHSVQVHHHGIPELRSHGETPESAAVNLAQDLAREIDGAVDDLHRRPLQRALDDVNASIERSA